MDKYAIAEVAYKNGYEAGVKEFAKELYNQFREYANYDRHHTFEILDRIASVEEYITTLQKN